MYRRWPRRTEQAQERKDEWNRAKKEFIKNFTHGRKRRRALARAILLNSDEAGAWTDELKKEANTQAIELRRTLHRPLGEVVDAQHLGEAQAIPEEGAPAETLSANELASGDLRMAVTTDHIDDLLDSMGSVNEISEASNETPEPKKGVTFGADEEMHSAEEDSGAEEDTEGVQAEGDTDANMSDWNEAEHTVPIGREVEKAWSKLPKASKAKNTKSEWVSKNVAAKKLVCMEEHRKDRSRAQAVARADKKKQERLQRKRAEMQKEQEKEQPEAPAAAATTDTVS